MTNYEFCWSFAPAGQCRWERKTTIDGLETEFVGDQIIIRADSTRGSEDELHGCAEAIAMSLAGAMSFRKAQKFALVFNHVKRTSTASGIEDIALHLADQLPGMHDDVNWTKVSHVKLDAVLLEDSRDADLDEVIALADKARRSASMQRMLNWQTVFYADPEKKLAPLFDIVELVEAEYGGESGAAQALGISRKALEKVKRVANDGTIRTARHPGKSSGTLRDITAEELAHCVRTAEAIIRSYAALTFPITQ